MGQGRLGQAHGLLWAPCEQEFGEVAADTAHSTGCSGHKDRIVVFMFRRHAADLGLR
jgi:hypothetical protein